MNSRTIIPVLCLCCWSVLAHAGEYRAEVKTKEILKATTTAAGQPIVYPRTDQPQVTASTVEIPSGGETGWHTHPVPLYAWVVAGTLTVEFEGGSRVEYREGDAIIEAVNTPQNGRNSGSTPVKLLIFSTGAVDVPNAVKTLVYEPGPASQGRQERQGVRQSPPEQKPAAPAEKKEDSTTIKLRYKEPIIE